MKHILAKIAKNHLIKKKLNLSNIEIENILYKYIKQNNPSSLKGIKEFFHKKGWTDDMIGNGMQGLAFKAKIENTQDVWRISE